MKIFIAIFLLCSVVSQPMSAQKKDKKLQASIEKLVHGFGGDIGVYVKDLTTNKIVAINADTIFPTASVIKIPILLGIMDKLNRGELTYHQQLQYKDSLLYTGEDILGSFKQDEKIELGKVAMLMLTMSDNTASLWLQSLAGGGLRINALLDSLGYTYTRVNSRTAGRETARTQYGWGQTTPREIATLVSQIYNEQIFSQAASDKMLRLLNRSYWDRVATSQIPPYATVFSKYGAVNETRNEVLLVKGAHSCYVFSVFTKNNKDQSWENNNEAWELTRKISWVLWQHFEPKDKWQPAADAQKFD